MIRVYEDENHNRFFSDEYSEQFHNAKDITDRYPISLEKVDKALKASGFGKLYREIIAVAIINEYDNYIDN